MVSELEDILSLKLQSDIMKFKQKLENSKISGKLNVTYKNDSLIFKLEIKNEENNSNYFSSSGIIELIIKLKREKEFKKLRKIHSKLGSEKIFVFLLLIIILIIIAEEIEESIKEKKELIMIDKADEILSEKNWGEKENNFKVFFEEMQD